MKTKTFYYKNNSLKRTYKTEDEAIKQGRKDCLKYNIRIETWEFDKLVQKVGLGNAERMWAN